MTQPPENVFACLSASPSRKPRPARIFFARGSSVQSMSWSSSFSGKSFFPLVAIWRIVSSATGALSCGR